MTSVIEETLGLPSLADALKNASEGSTDTNDSNIDETNNTDIIENEDVAKLADGLQNIDPKLLERQDVMGVDDHIDEVNDIYELAISAHKDLMTLGFNMEPKNAGANAFMPGAKMLEIALKASQSKTDKKMEKIRLIMEQEEHKRNILGSVEDGEVLNNSNSILANRNDLMDKIRKGEI